MSGRPRLRPAVLKLLAGGFRGVLPEIAGRVYGHPVAVQRVVKTLHDEGLIRVSRWRGGLPVWRNADGQPDSVRPKKKKPKVVAPKVRVSRTRPNDAGRKALVREWFAQRARPSDAR